MVCPLIIYQFAMQDDPFEASAYLTLYKFIHNMAKDEDEAPSSRGNSKVVAQIHRDISSWLVVEPYSSEKYDIVNWDDDIPNIWEHNNCSKPRTSQGVPSPCHSF